MAGRAPTTPSTPTTVRAPVREFRCLFSHDIRRKSKRWQDGYLRYHAFNRRVVVVDDSRNVVGDIYCRERDDLQDGDEFALESGVLVQVGEWLATTETDLTSLLQKKTKRAVIACDGGGGGAASSSGSGQQRQHAAAAHPPRHSSLNSLLARRGAQGRAATPARSPYELRHNDAVEETHGHREGKRRRVAAPADSQVPDGYSSVQRSDTSSTTGMATAAATAATTRRQADLGSARPTRAGDLGSARATKASDLGRPTRAADGRPVVEVLSDDSADHEPAGASRPRAANEQKQTAVSMGAGLDRPSERRLHNAANVAGTAGNTLKAQTLRLASRKPRTKLLLQDDIENAAQSATDGVAQQRPHPFPSAHSIIPVSGRAAAGPALPGRPPRLPDLLRAHSLAHTEPLPLQKGHTARSGPPRPERSTRTDQATGHANPGTDRQGLSNLAINPLQPCHAAPDTRLDEETHPVLATGHAPSEDAMDELGPWTAEALDFFDWRPPDWAKGGRGVKSLQRA